MRVPTYESGIDPDVIDLPRSRRRDPRADAFARFGIAGQDLGVALMRREAERKELQDTADARNAYNSYVEQSIEFKNSLELKKGAEARNVAREYTDWHNKTLESIKKDFIHTDEADSLFRLYSTKHYLSKLASVSKYQAQEEQNYNQSVLDKNLQNLSADLTVDPYAMVETPEGDTVHSVEIQLEDYHATARAFLGGAYTADDEGDVEAKVKSDAISAMIVADPTRADEWIEKWKTDIGPEAYSKFKKTAETELLKQQSDIVYDAARVMDDVDTAVDFVNESGLPRDERRKIISNIYTDFDRKDRETEEQQNKIIKQNDLDTVRFYYQGTLNADDLDTLAEGQQISRGVYQWAQNQLREDQKVTENNAEVVANIAAHIELRAFSDANQMLSEALVQGNIKGETYISMTQSLASKQFSDAMGYINKAMQPSELEIDFFKKQKHAEAVADLAIRVAEGDDPMLAAKEIVKLNRTSQTATAARFRRPKYLKGDKDNMIHLADTKFETTAAYRKGLIGPEEYIREMELIEQLENALTESQNYKTTDEELDKAIKELKIGQ